MFRIALLLTASLVASPTFADEPLPKRPETFDVAGHAAFVYAAPRPAADKPWVWFAPTLKGVSLAGRKAYYEAFLGAGGEAFRHALCNGRRAGDRHRGHVGDEGLAGGATQRIT